MKLILYFLFFSVILINPRNLNSTFKIHGKYKLEFQTDDKLKNYEIIFEKKYCTQTVNGNSEKSKFRRKFERHGPFIHLKDLTGNFEEIVFVERDSDSIIFTGVKSNGSSKIYFSEAGTIIRIK